MATLRRSEITAGTATRGVPDRNRRDLTGHAPRPTKGEADEQDLREGAGHWTTVRGPLEDRGSEPEAAAGPATWNQAQRGLVNYFGCDLYVT